MLDSFCHEVNVGSPVLFIKGNKYYHGYITDVIDENKCKCTPNLKWMNPVDAKEGKKYTCLSKNVYLLIVKNKN